MENVLGHAITIGDVLMATAVLAFFADTDPSTLIVPEEMADDSAEAQSFTQDFDELQQAIDDARALAGGKP